MVHEYSSRINRTPACRIRGYSRSRGSLIGRRGTGRLKETRGRDISARSHNVSTYDLSMAFPKTQSFRKNVTKVFHGPPAQEYIRRVKIYGGREQSSDLVVRPYYTPSPSVSPNTVPANGARMRRFFTFRRLVVDRFLARVLVLPLAQLVQLLQVFRFARLRIDRQFHRFQFVQYVLFVVRHAINGLADFGFLNTTKRSCAPRKHTHTHKRVLDDQFCLPGNNK